MSDETPSIHDEWQSRFPDMQPVKSPPTLFRMNGCGVSVYGKRDYDIETNTYVKTHCICLVFIPILAIGAYRVADAERGWYFIGKVPLSTFAKTWNKTVVMLAIILFLGLAWTDHVNSPEYQTAKKMDSAAELMTKGDHLGAAKLYREVATGPINSLAANNELQKAIEAGLNDEPTKAVPVYKFLSDLPPKYHGDKPMIIDEAGKGLKLAKAVGASKPADGLAVLQAVAKIEPANRQLPVLREELLVAALKAEPGQLDYLNDLAIIYDQTGRTKECTSLLEPHKGELKDTEAARILGQNLMADGNYNDAYTLLYPYVQGRIENLNKAESAYTNAIQHSYNSSLNALRKGHGSHDFYTAYDKASKEEQDRMVNEYLEDNLQKDAGFKRAINELKKANKIVPVTLDLGIVQLNRAQSFTDPAKRKAELEAAEKTFLAIQTSAGESDEYRMFLGQVYYWLGKSSEGKILFDELLASKKRSVPVLLMIANTYRDVGDRNEARKLSEEAYGKATIDKQRFAAASVRGYLQKSADDQIEWLKKSDPKNVHDQIALKTALAQKAIQTGNKTQAAQYLHEAVAAYANLPKASSTLNNSALAYMDLFSVTGNLDDYRKGVSLMEESISLEPGNSILLGNVTSILTAEAIMETLGDTVHCEQLGQTPALDLLSHTYRDDREHNATYARMGQTEAMKKAMHYLDQALLLAPKSLDLYEEQMQLAVHNRDLPALKLLAQRFQNAQIDMSQRIKDAVEGWSAAKRDKKAKDLQNYIKRLEEQLTHNGSQADPLVAEYLNATRDTMVMALDAYGQKPDSAQLLNRAREAYEAHDCTATLSAYINACYFKAHLELKARQPEYARLAEQTKDILNPKFLCLLVMEKGGALAQQVRQHPDIQTGSRLEMKEEHRFPSFQNPEYWILLRHFATAESEKYRQGYLQDEMSRRATELTAQLDPMNAPAVLELYWASLMEGKKAEAEAVYTAAIQRGLPLPKL